MKILTLEQTLGWIAQQRSLVVDEEELRFKGAVVPELHYDNPTGEGQLLYFARSLTCLHHHESLFAGGLLWITSWGVWSPWVEDVGRKTFSMLRREEGTLAAFRESPGQLFGADELLESAAFLVQPILVGWDAYFYPLFRNVETDFIVRVSHDACVDVLPATAEARGKIFERFRGTGIEEYCQEE